MAFVQQCHLNIHRRIHTGEKPFKCEMCHQRFKQVSHLTTHMRVHTNDKPFSCSLCKASFSQTSSLKRHKRRHTGEKPFRCEICGALFVERRNLSRHQLTHTGEKPYKCEKCPASFTQMIDLKRHQMSHSGLKPFKCDVCDAAFSRKNNLRWHKLTHEGDTPYRCERCNAGFIVQRDMKAHMRTHSGSKPFSCDQCGATFSQFSTLKRHRQSHTGERHFVCSKCHGAFKDKSALKRHMLRHDGVKPFACKKCDSTFMEFRNLKRHKVTVHGEERFEGDGTTEPRENENNQNIPPPKKRTGKLEEDEALSQIYDTGYQTSLVQHQETPQQQQHVSQPVSLAPPTPLSHNQQQPHTAAVQTHPQPPLINEIVTIPAQGPGQMPTLLLTQPGQPPKTARPANNCQNHQSHILTFVEDSYNHWQSWCFCETPNIPDASQTILDNAGAVSTHPSTSAPVPAAAGPQHQQMTYTELQQPTGQQQQQQQTVVQEVSQAEYQQATQFNSGYPEPIHHYDESHHQEPLDPLAHHHQQLHQPHSHQDEVKIAIDSPRLFTVAGINHDEQQQQEQQPHQQQQEHHEQQQHQQLEQQQHLQPHQDHHEHRESHQQVDPQVTFQYSLTVNNPATGDIQIQSEAFPANPPDPPADPPIKKRRLTKTADTQEVRTYNCSNCPKTFSRINHLLIHQRTHTGEKPFQCGVCNQSFTHKNSLTIHMRGHTGERPYVCVICKASFTQKSNLRVHSRTHTGEKPFKCDTCDVAFTQGSHLTAHKRIHNNDRPFACENCQQTFTQRSALKRHLMTHTGDKPHKCHDCNAKFSQKDDLRRHQRVHSGDKPISCTYEYCTVPFSDKIALARHIRTVHQGKPESPGDGPKKKKRKSVAKQSTNENNSPKTTKTKSKVPLAEPTRTSKRLREAAEKKKDKPEDSDFIIGDFVEIEEDIKPPVRQKLPKKSAIKMDDVKVEAKNKMESWCFCEVPHGPDEPHTHVAVESKSRSNESTTILSSVGETNPHVSSQQETAGLIASADATGATSLLQLSMEHVTHNPTATGVISGGLQTQSVGGTVTINASPIVTASHVEPPVITGSTDQHSQVTSVGQADSSGNQSLASGQVVTTMGQPGVPGQASGRIAGQSMLTTGQVVSAGQIVGASQLMTQEGAIIIEAGEMLSNGTVVINPGQGTFISYDQITISPDGQVRKFTCLPTHQCQVHS